MKQNIQAAADALWQARATRQTIARISETFEIRTVQDAYAVAEANVARSIAGGARVCGKKIGLTSKAVQQQLGVDQPDYGVLFADMEFVSGAMLPANALIQPKAEGEIAIVVGRDLDETELSWGRFLVGLEYALPAIEIVDSAINDWNITLVDTVADNASCGVYVLGLEPRRIGDVVLAGCGMDFRKNGNTASVGAGVACLGNPLTATYWLAKKMAELGQPLRAGDIVMSGALGPMVPVTMGDHVEVEISGLGRVTCSLGDAR
ncbi:MULTISPECIES: 2-keto-4-pentenoate hydratase [unclassified Burkholderia]|uniref:2-keto-4-pentenoate hydratase n=1 Tax=unclassified Burkholderia TaxID=2613784 RepID=UPI000F59FB84|nr:MULTISPECIES: fumarylacetoacetate hydrolase family protein [unclassified Burkholderia]RQS24205.1 2-keto-4-pentenoate hydratase [Burkholderia sp. Bp8995]RQS37929.1 2-keto-4-pentenoate hydratase [Burkholderia sp. Bp8989]